MAILDPAIRRSSTTAARLATAAALVAISVPVAAVQLKDAAPVSTVSANSIRAAVEQAAAPAAAAPSQAPGSINAPRPAASAPQPARDQIVGVALARMLVEAVQRGNREQIAELLAAGANVNAPVPGDGSAEIEASWNGSVGSLTSGTALTPHRGRR